MNETVSCNICVNRAFCHYRRIAFERGTISWESHLNKVEKLGCGYYKPQLTEGSIVLTKEQIEHPTDDKVIEFFAKHNEKVRKQTVEMFITELYKELYQLGRIYALPETLDADKYGIFSLTQQVIAKIAKEQFGVEVKE